MSARTSWMAWFLIGAMTGCAGQYSDYLDEQSPPEVGIGPERPGSGGHGGVNGVPAWPDVEPWADGSALAGDPDPDERVISPPPGVTGLQPGEVTDFAASVSFLYDGAMPAQAGVDPEDIDADRIAVIRGRVLDTAGSGISGVATSILGHPEFGYTMTRSDGGFDLAVNGGRSLVVQFRSADHLPAQRRVQAPWRDYTWTDDVVLLPPDAEVTSVNLDSPAAAQVARGSIASDDDGDRRATVIMPAGVSAWMDFADGSSESLVQGSFRATEFTVGPDGPARMPASLPASSVYTYAVELGFDEAVAAGATSVVFDRPLALYVENFLDLPVGGRVPAGYLDPQQGAWVRSGDGVVLEVVGIGGGRAELDLEGDGSPASPAMLDDLGIDDDELVEIAGLYAAGQTLWRVPVEHFTAWDLNFGYGVPAGAQMAGALGGGLFEEGHLQRPCTQVGSIIECQTQVLGERIPLAGMPYTLNYRSSRVSGFVEGNTVRVNLIGHELPAASGFVGLRMQIEIAGRVWDHLYPPDPEQAVVWTWDGLDAYGREVQGAQPVEIEIGYEYVGSYQQPQQGFGSPGGGAVLTADPARQTVILWQGFEAVLGTVDHRVQGLGGWSLDVHHHYDPVRQTVYFGDGTWQGGQSAFVFTIDTEASLPLEPAGMDVAYDGAVYVAVPDAHQVVAIHPDGSTETVAGNGTGGWSGDGSLAVDASLSSPQDVAVGPDGSIYIADRGNDRVRKVAPDGIITTIAGTLSPGYNGDGIPAIAATLYNPNGVAVTDDGTIFIADTWNERVRQVGTDGIITTYAGNGSAAYCGDGGAATDACLYTPMGIDVAHDGSVYVADHANDRVRVITPDGLIDTVAGNGSWGYEGDGGAATDATFRGPIDVTVSRTSDVYIADLYNHVIRRVRPDGVCETFAGKGEPGFGGDHAPAREATMAFVEAVATSPAGDVFVSDSYNRKVRKVGSFAEWCSFDEVGIPSRDGREVFVFDGLTGQHRRTIDALTGETVLEFGYDGGWLTTVEDRFGNLTSIGREGAGDPSWLRAPGGQDITLQLDADGWLDTVELPGGRIFDPEHHPDGLLQAFTSPGGGSSSYEYDALGHLVEAYDAVGAHKVLSRVVDVDGLEVEYVSGEGRTHAYGVYSDDPGSWWTRYLSPSGGWQETWHHDDASLFALREDGTEVAVFQGPDPRWEMFVPVEEEIEVRLPSGLYGSVESLRLVGLDDPDDPLSLQWQQDSTWVNGKHFVRTWEAADDSVSWLTPEGRETRIWFDQGRPVEIAVHPAVQPVVFEYTAEGLLESISRGGLGTTFTHDASQQLTGFTDAMGRVTELQYDDAGEVERVVQPGGREFQLEHDLEGNLVGVEMPSGAVHELEYTPLGQPARYTPPGGGAAMEMTWDLDGEIASISLPTGRTISHVREATGARLTSVDYDEATVTLAYADATPRPSEVTASPVSGPSHTTAYEYDGLLVTAVETLGAAAGDFTYQYNPDFQLQSVRFASGGFSHVTDVGYDDDGRVIEQGPFGVVRLGPGGTPSVIMGGGAMTSYAYDDLGRVAGRRNTADLQELYELDVEFGDDGRIRQRVETVAGTTHVYEYEHDLDGQLVAVNRDGQAHESFAYDDNGNRTLGPCGTASFDDRDRLLACGTTPYTHDADGFLSSRGADTFTYSARGELLEAEVAGEVIRYAYDGLGRRVLREDDQGSHAFFYGDLAHPFRVTAARLPDGTLDVYHRDEAGLLIAVEHGAGTPGAELFHIATDQVGTPRVVFTGDAVVIKVLQHDSFGALQSDTNPDFDLPLGFAGGIHDPDTGLVRFGFRDYDPTTARWTAPDPLLFGGGQFNLYAYVNSDPIDFVDPSGLFLPAGLAAGALFGAGFGAAQALTVELLESQITGRSIDWRRVASAAAWGGAAGLAGFAFGSSMVHLTYFEAVSGGLVSGYVGGVYLIFFRHIAPDLWDDLFAMEPC